MKGSKRMGNDDILVIVKEPNKDWEVDKIKKGKEHGIVLEWMKNKIGVEYPESTAIKVLDGGKYLSVYLDKGATGEEMDVNVWVRLSFGGKSIVNPIHGTVVFVIEDRWGVRSITDKEIEALNIIQNIAFESDLRNELVARGGIDNEGRIRITKG